jgi:hypothetical protein
LFEAHASAERVQDTDDRYFIGVFRWGFDFPDTLTTIAAVLLWNARLGGLQARGELVSTGLRRAIEMRVGSPSKMPGSMQHLLHAHLEDHVGVRADPGTARSHIP